MKNKTRNSKIETLTAYAACILLLTLPLALYLIPGAISSAENTGISAESVYDPADDAAGESVPQLSASETLDRIIVKIAADELTDIGVSKFFAENISIIEKEFGSDAWEKVSYTEIEAPPVFLRDAYVICETGEEITAVEYDRILEKHVTDVCAKYGYERSLLEKTGAEICGTTQDEITKYHEVNAEIEKTCPVKLIGVPDGESKRFMLQFGGKSVSGEAGIYDVVIDLVKIDDVWQFHSILYSNVTLPGEDV